MGYHATHFWESLLNYVLRPWSFRNNVHNDQGKRRASDGTLLFYATLKGIN